MANKIRITDQNDIRPGGLLGSERITVEDIRQKRFYDVQMQDIADLSAGIGNLTDGEGTTVNGTAIDWGGTFDSDITLEGGARELTLRTTNRTLVKYLQFRAPENNILLAVSDTARQGYITIAPDSLAMFFYNSNGGGSFEGDDGRVRITSWNSSDSNNFDVEPNGIAISNLKSGATQIASGAGINELWITNSHATLPDGVIMIGL